MWRKRVWHSQLNQLGKNRVWALLGDFEAASTVEYYSLETSRWVLTYENQQIALKGIVSGTFWQDLIFLANDSSNYLYKYDIERAGLFKIDLEIKTELRTYIALISVDSTLYVF